VESVRCHFSKKYSTSTEFSKHEASSSISSQHSAASTPSPPMEDSTSNSIITQSRELVATAEAHSQLTEEYACGKNLFNVDTSCASIDVEESEEFEARARLEELLKNAKTLQIKAESTSKKVSNFDPASMNVAKRSEQRTKMKPSIDEDVEVSSFKALPLPGNTPVRNNPLAFTKSFVQKIGSVDRLIRLDNDTASVMTSIASKNDVSLDCYENEEEKEQARQVRAKKNIRKRNLLDEVNNILLQEGSLSDDASIVQVDGERVEDPSILSQQIAQLESKLKHEKTQRLATLNDIVDIDLNALFDRLITEDAGEEATKIVDRLKSKVYENINDFGSYSVESSQDEEVFADIDMNPPTLFKMQQEWVKRRDQKRFEAKMQLEADTMRDITGKPELGNAKRSWIMAKEAHEEALERAQQNATTPNKVLSKDNDKDKGRELKVIDWQKAKESHDQALKRATQQEEMKRKAREEKEKAVAMEEIQYIETVEASVSKKESKTKQKERPQYSSFQSQEALRKSSVQIIEHTRRRSKLQLQEEIFLRSKSNVVSDVDVSGESVRKMESNINSFLGKSYAEMSEKEFNKLVKKLLVSDKKM
jgi:hypothetical protein